MLLLAVVLVVVLMGVVVAAGLWCWMRYRLAIYDAQHAEELIAANRAAPRPGMATPDARFRVVGGRTRGPYAG